MLQKGETQKGIGHFFCFGHFLVTILSLFGRLWSLFCLAFPFFLRQGDLKVILLLVLKGIFRALLKIKKKTSEAKNKP